MQNKYIKLKTEPSAPSQRYRSIKYRINTSVTEDTTRSLSTTRHLPITNSSLKKNKHLSSSAVHHSITVPTEDPERIDRLSTIQVKQPYLSTFSKLFLSSKLDPTLKAPRVHLPHIIEYTPSMFTALDPLRLPIAHIEEQIARLEAQLPLPPQQMQRIRSGLKQLEKETIKKLEEVQKTTINSLSRLRDLLRQNHVDYQQNALHFKRTCFSLKDSDDKFKKNFESTKPRLAVLQEQIFSCQPFDLARSRELNEQFPQLYF